MTLAGAVVVFSPGLLTGGESVSARAFITEALPRPVVGAWAVFFSFVIPNAALGRLRELTSLRGFPLPCPTAGISSVSSGIFEAWASIKKSESQVLQRDAILNVYNKFTRLNPPSYTWRRRRFVTHWRSDGHAIEVTKSTNDTFFMQTKSKWNWAVEPHHIFLAKVIWISLDKDSLKISS